MKNFKRFRSYLRYERKHLVLISIFVVFYVLATLSQSFLIGKALDAALASNQKQFLTIVIISISLAVIGVIAGYLFEYFVNKLTQNITYKIRYEVCLKINSLPVSYFSNHQSGNILQLEIADTENVTNGLSALFKSFVEGGLTILTTLVLMFVLNWVLAIGVVILSPLSIFMAKFIADRSHKYFKKQVELQSELNSISKECINNIDLIQSNNYEAKSFEKYEKSNEVLRKHGNIALFSASWVNPSTRLVNNFIYVLIGVIGIVMISYSSSGDMLQNIGATMSIGSLASFLVYINQYSKPFNEISSAAAEYENARSSFERINKFLDEDDDFEFGSGSINHLNSITFKDVFFSYDKDISLIESFSQEIKNGNHVAIVGPTGAGKSTLINLLMGFYKIDKGDIKYNDISFSELSKESIRKNIGLVLQEPWIFKGTVMENIKYAKQDASDEEVIECCKNANIDKFINLLPFGYETVISSKEDLSEGEKQLISIARLMLLKPNVVVLDEATSNIDTRSEKFINEAFDAIMKDKTSIVIAHRLSTIVSADTIIVLNNGKIVEIGNHKSLMKKEGFYFKLFSSQFESI